MATTFKDIRAKIQAVVDTLDTIKKSYNYEASTFSDGFPAAVIVPTDNEAAFASTQKDRLVFVFTIKIYYEIKEESEHELAEGFLEAVVDEMLTTFRDKSILNPAADWVEPVPTIWYYEERGEAIYRATEINLRCVKYLG